MKILNNIVQEDLELEKEAKRREMECYFQNDKVKEDNEGHPVGECMHCDWSRQNMRATGWDDPKFCEWWDYHDYWHHRIKLKKD
jgi:hypothetical protein